MDIDLLLVPLGITTYVFLLATVLAGLLKAKLKYHRLLAYLSLSLATMHASLAIYLNFFRR